VVDSLGGVKHAECSIVAERGLCIRECTRGEDTVVNHVLVKTASRVVVTYIEVCATVA